MKQLFVTVLLFFSFFTIFSQQIEKELVVVEISTGTWCTYCPGAAMGADDLVENFGDAVAIIENHGSDSYENTSSAARTNYYAVQYFPSAVFNGGNMEVGGDHNNSLYPVYLPKYNSAASVMTSFDISMDVTPVDDNTFDVTVTIDKVHDYSGTNLVAQLALTETHIEESWQGMSELNFVNRAMYPSASGTVLDFSSVSQETLSFTVNIDETWIVEECELVAFVQDNSTKEILQGTKKSLNIPIGSNNVMLKNVNYPTGNISICEDAISPIITVKNKGSETLNTFVVEYEINNEGIQTYNWTGSLAYSETSEIILDEIIYTSVEDNNLEINLILPNGVTDDDQSNNSSTISFDKSAEATTIVYLEIDPNGSFYLPWQLYSSTGTILYQGNGSGSEIINETFELDIDKCHSFYIEYTGNGIPGDGYFSLTSSDGSEVFYSSGSSFNEDITVPFKVTTVSGIRENDLKNITVYPNPANEQVFIDSDGYNINQITITNISGKELFSDFSNKNKSKIIIDTSSLSSGMYFVNINTETGIITRKISVIN